MARSKGTTIDDTTEMMIAFVSHLLSNGGKRTKAALAAGYAEKSAAVAASRLMRNPKVLSLLKDETTMMLAALAPAAVVRMGKLINNRSGYVALETARDILTRNSIGVLKEAPKTQPLVININLGVPARRDVVIDGNVVVSPEVTGGVQKLPITV